MNGWVHEDGDADGVCLVFIGIHCEKCMDPVQCLCNTPTPDPSSPCGYEGCVPGDLLTHEPCEFWAVLEHPWSGCHPHQPTRCTCGHPIEERA